MRRWTIIAVAVVVALALGTVQLVESERRPLDHSYRLAVTFTDSIAGPFDLRVPLPADAEFQQNWTWLGNVSAAVEDSPYGKVLHFAGEGNVSAASYLTTWRDVPTGLTTEGTDAAGRDAAWVYYNSSGRAGTPHLNLSVREIDPVWTTERFVNGDLPQEWSAVDVREEITHVHE